jgi:hypothetical protein
VLEDLAGFFGISAQNLEALWSMGPSKTLNSGARYETGPTNLLQDTRAADGASWSETRVSISADAIAGPDGTVTADKIVEDSTASNTHYINQQETVVVGVQYEFQVTIKAAGRTWAYLRIYDGSLSKYAYFDLTNGVVGTVNSPATGSITDLGNGWYKCSITWAVTDTSGIFYISGTTANNTTSYNGDGSSGIYVTDMTLCPKECPSLIEQVGADRQSIYDWSGNSKALQVGSTTGADANDPSHLIESYNLLAAGTAKDLEHADWTPTDATVNDATTFTPSALDGQVVIPFTGVASQEYIVSATIASAGNTSLEWTLDAVETSVTVTASEVRYSIVYTGDGAAANIGLRDPNAAGFGAITFTDIQIEIVPTGTTTPLPFQDSAEPIFVGAHCDYDGVDNYCAVDYSAIGAGTVIVVARQDSQSANGTLWASGNSSTEVFVNTSGDLFIRSDSNLQATSVDFALGLYSIYVFTFDGVSGGVVYQDTSATSITFSASAEVGTNLRIGGDVQNSNDFFDGSIPLVAVYSRVLTPAEVATATKNIAQAMWDYRGIACLGVSGVDYTVAPANL